jgi:Flp pilus assembly protein TadD
MDSCPSQSAITERSTLLAEVPSQAPDDETLYLNLGRVYLSLGARDKARDVMQQLLARKPGDPVATRALRELDSR